MSIVRFYWFSSLFFVWYLVFVEIVRLLRDLDSKAVAELPQSPAAAAPAEAESSKGIYQEDGEWHSYICPSLVFMLILIG